MQNSKTFTQFIYKNIYLLLIAAGLITLSFVVDNYWSENATFSSVKKKIETYIHQQETDFNKLVTDTISIKNISSKKLDITALKNLVQKKYFLYVYQFSNINQPEIVFWNTQTVQPADTLLHCANSIGFIQLQNGYYVWEKSSILNGFAIAIIPIKWNYAITNEYLKNNFAVGDGIQNNFDIDSVPTAASIKSQTGKQLFYLQKKNNVIIEKNNLTSIWMRILAVFFIFLFIHLCTVYIATYARLSNAILFLITTIFLLRTISYYFSLPLNFRQFELFDPGIYGSNVILRSLGDLLINAFLCTWVILFIRYQIQEKKYTVSQKLFRYKWVFLFFAATLFVVVTFVCGRILKSIVADSQISFDVINFFALNIYSIIYSIIAFAVLCCIAICYFLFAQIMLHLLKPMFFNNFAALYIAVSVLGLLLLTIGFNVTIVTFELYLLLWLLIFLTLLNSSHLTLFTTHLSSTRLVFWLFFFSLSMVIVIVNENNAKELSNRKHYAETLSSKAVPASETLMNTLLTDFRSELLAPNFYKFYAESSNQKFKDSLVNSNFSVYTNKYDTKIYTFDKNENPLFNKDASSFNELTTILNTQAKATGIADLFYFDEAYDKFSYIVKRNVTDTSGFIVGYVFIIARSKQYKPDAPYPELFSRGNENAIENSTAYSFAVYDNLKLISNHNDYSFSTSLSLQDIPKSEFEIKEKNNFSELWYKAGPKNVVIIAKPNNLFLESTTLFSYLFCSFLLVTTAFWLLSVLAKFWLSKWQLKIIWQLSIRNQIHGTIIFISIFSFVIIGIATIMFFIQRYQSNNKEQLTRTIKIMENEVRNSLTDLAVFDDVVKIYDGAFKEKLSRSISKISEIHAADINLYDVDGNLKVSSIPLPYDKGIVSTRMDPVAYFHLNKLKEVEFFKDEQIGSLKFVSNYVPVLDENGKDYAYLNIPYFSSESKLKTEIANFLVTIINLNAFIFLIAGIVALFITNTITNSFLFISNKMKEVNLGKKNEAILWKRNDEIGELVKQYNTMVDKLDKSALSLAKSERESAWREMARQVAHEIKNPLTPMKLSLQYLQKAIKNNSENVKELTTSVTQTLVEQIGHLNQIAGDFSQFANIGNSQNEIFDLHEVLNLVVQLYSVNDNVKIYYKPIPTAVLINADRTQMNRLFTNLIQNAVQAAPQNVMAQINIDEDVAQNKILIKIKDNGIGIAPDIISKIFTPNFTTKTSGTGLGLAMCKGIAEQAKGKIWFDTKEIGGTIFFVELPLQKQ